VTGSSVIAERIENLHVSSSGTTSPPEAAPVRRHDGPARTPFAELLRDVLAGGRARRLRRVAERLAKGFGDPCPEGRALDRAARDYRRGLLLALRADPALAEVLFRAHDARIPPRHYPLTRADESRLAGLTCRDDLALLTVVFEVATRLRLDDLQLRALDRTTDLLVGHGTASTAVTCFRRWQELRLLDRGTVTAVLRGCVSREPLENDHGLWAAFFQHLPRSLTPDLFEVHCFLDDGAAAARLADTPSKVHRALLCCLHSPALADAEAGLVLARECAGNDLVVRHAEHLADLLFEGALYDEALHAYREAGRHDRTSPCHEGLGRFPEALATCPAHEVERLARLAGLCVPGVRLLGERREFVEAAQRVQDVIGHLDRATGTTGALIARRAEVAGLREDLLRATRRRFTEQARGSGSGSDAERAVYLTWSRFEEAAGELALAAWRAEDAGEFFRANRLFHRAGRFGEAARVLQGDDTPEGLGARAEAYEAGGDPLGAARLYERSGEPERAVELFLRAEDFDGAAHCLTRWLGDLAVEDGRLADCLRRTGEHEDLVRRCLVAVDARGGRSRAAAVLRGLAGDRLVPAHLASEVDAALDELVKRERLRFQQRAQGWVARARAEVDQRYSRTWGFDLGTTTCAAAVYDTRAQRPVFCPWKGDVQFASTLSLDEHGDELVGLSGEEVLAPWLVGHVSAAKRRMGDRAVFTIRDRAYRPEEVAARMIRHARGLVESFLAGRVRERVGELAGAELGEVGDELLSWAEREHDLRLDRPRVVVTIPAFFANNQKDATRSACAIAEVELVRLVHEPTAACITAAREKRLSGTVAVVDLGAGTLDISLLEVDDNVYEVRDVGGDTHFGGRDLDTAITGALAARLRREGVPVPAAGVVRRRLEVAAERLKIDLSAQEQAACTMPGFGPHGVTRLELDRAELSEVLAEPLAVLRRTCAEFAAGVQARPERLVLVGRPMLSPLVREVVERAFGVRRTVVTDPRTAVASGAALLAAMLDGALRESVLLDVTPLSLGIRAVGRDDVEHLSELVARATTIPTKRSETYTTRRDNQSEVDVEVFTGALSAGSKIGQFVLSGIEPAAKGVPQIEVTFEIDANCVLSVTAHDLGTGKVNAVRIADTTLLSPAEVALMTERYERQREHERRLRDWKDVRQRLRDAAVSTTGDDGAAVWREFRRRQLVHRPSPGAQDEATRLALVEMFGEAGQTEVDLHLARTAAHAAAAAALRHVDRPVAAGADLRADTDRAAELLAELLERADRVRGLVARIGGWNAVLARQEGHEPDPALRFRDLCAAGEHRRALEALADLPAPLTDPGDVLRHARCLAEVGDAEGYRSLRGATVDRLDLTSGGVLRVASGWGFLVGERLVATSAQWVTDPATGRPAELGDIAVGPDAVRVERVHLADSPVALLVLAAPVDAAPLPLGHPRLVRVGDHVWSPAPDGTTGCPRLTGLVDRFEPPDGHGPGRFLAGLRVPPSRAGAPVLDEFGEVIGVLTAGGADDAPVVGVDALDDLLREAGFDRRERGTTVGGTS
jgi:molecular chaperone DnaK